MAAKPSFSRLADIFLVLSALSMLPMLLLSHKGGAILLIPAHVFLYLGILGAIVGGWQSKRVPGEKLLLAFILLTLLMILGPIVLAAYSFRSF